MKKTALFLFILSAIGTLLSGVTGMMWLHLASKPMIMATLIFYYFAASEKIHRSATVILAMLFSLAGDVLLLDSSYFIAGLSAFLLAHVLYIFSYRQHQREESKNALLGIQRARLAFPIVLAGTGLVVVLYPVLGDLKIPVIVYAFVIALMVITALFRYGRTTAMSFWTVFTGAVLFMLSDGILAINKFLHPVPSSDLWIMLTYISAQYLIVRGLLMHSDRTLEEVQISK